MTCRDVREVADSFLCEELLTETNHDILQHLDTCPSCRAEVEGRRRLRGALRTAFDRAPDLQPARRFRGAAARRSCAQAGVAPSSLVDAVAPMARRLRRAWWLAAGLTTFVLMNRSLAPADALARDAIGDHRNCALKVSSGENADAARGGGRTLRPRLSSAARCAARRHFDAGWTRARRRPACLRVRRHIGSDTSSWSIAAASCRCS